jgi:hypothetical protein
MRTPLVIVLILLAGSQTASATDCRSWRKIGPEAQQDRITGMISAHVNSNVSKRYTSEDRVAIQRCLREFSSEIGEEFDAACSERPGANAEVLDDIFDRFLLSCIR